MADAVSGAGAAAETAAAANATSGLRPPEGMATAGPVASTRRRADPGWRAVAAAFAVNGLLFGAWAARVPAFKDRFALDAAALGLVLLALGVGALASFLVAGHLSERHGAPRVTRATVALYGPALLLLALAPNAVLLGLALFAFGTLHGGMDVAMNGWAVEVEDRLGRPTLSVFHAIFSLGAGLGAATGWAAAGAGVAPLPHFAIVALAGGALAFAVVRRGAAAEPVRPRAGDAAPALALPRGPLLLVGLIAFGIAMGEGAMADWSAVFLRQILDASEGRAALGYAVFSAAMVAMRLGGDRLTRRVGPVRAARGSALVAAAGLVVVLLAPGLPVALVGFALTGIGYAVVMPLVFARAARDPVVAPGHALAAVATLAYGGMLLGPPLVGFVAAATSVPVAFGALVLLALLSAGLAGFLSPRRTT